MVPFEVLVGDSMKLSKSVTCAVLSSAMICFASPSQASVLGVDFLADKTYEVMTVSNFTLGYAFSLSSGAQLDGLGFWDKGNGYGETMVGLWDSTGNSLGAVSSGKTSVKSFADAAGLGFWNFMDIDLKLSPGNYVVGSWSANMDYVFSGALPTSIVTHDLDFLSTRQEASTFLQFPTIDRCSGCTSGYFGGNVRFGDANVVPEPGTLALLGLSLAGLGVMRRRRNT